MQTPDLPALEAETKGVVLPVLPGLQTGLRICRVEATLNILCERIQINGPHT
jgi:hypothetical protein